MAFALPDAAAQYSRPVTFCNEVIPINDAAVYSKLMNVLKRYVSIVNMPSLRSSCRDFFPFIEAQLRLNGLPEDFKYLPIVESNFRIVQSKAGAHGFWQLMPETAKQYGLRIEGMIDDREDVQKSTIAACKLLKDYYNYISKTHNRRSWVLTAAAYNFGSGNISNAIRKTGGEYFTGMQLNEETAMYVYKIIAVKELFEYPEEYNKNYFNYNVFRQQAPAAKPGKLPVPVESPTLVVTTASTPNAAAELTVPEDALLDTSLFMNMQVPDEDATPPVVVPMTIKYSKAYIKENIRHFEDGAIISFDLAEDIDLPDGFSSAGAVIHGQCYLIDGLVYINMNYDAHTVQVFDRLGSKQKGVPIAALKKGTAVFIRVEMPEY